MNRLGLESTTKGGRPMVKAVDETADHSTALVIALEEFKALREEIGNRSSAQHTLINLNITAVGTIGGLVIAYHGSPLVLLIVPLLSSALGLLFVDHAYNISRIGWYIGDKLWSFLRQMPGSDKIPTYEEEVAAYEQRKIARIGYGVPFFFMFSGPPIFGLVFSFGSLGAAWAIALWVVGLLMLIDLIVSWWVFLSRPFAKSALPQIQLPRTDRGISVEKGQKL